MDIREILDSGPPLIWRVGKVATLYPGKMYVDVVLGQVGDAQAPMMRQVTYMRHYTPKVGDTVHILVKSDMGALILGTISP